MQKKKTATIEICTQSSNSVIREREREKLFENYQAIVFGERGKQLLAKTKRNISILKQGSHLL